MIYLIITTSINNRYGSQAVNERKERYLYAIKETLKQLPYEITPIIVENNGKRETYLDNIGVKVLYTENNKQPFKSKGVNELLDIKEVIEKCNIKDDDIVIKLTGRYRVLSPKFFKDVIENKNRYDAFVKFFGSCTLKFEIYDCILGCYAMRAKYIKLFNHYSIDNYKSAEIALARYVRLSGARLKEVETLDVECCFAEDNRILVV
jgi:CMP-2-keto-3-deoxyoctulosonic acid synthetase